MTPLQGLGLGPGRDVEAELSIASSVWTDDNYSWDLEARKALRDDLFLELRRVLSSFRYHTKV